MIEQHGRHRTQRRRGVILLWIGTMTTTILAVVILVGLPTEPPPVPLRQEIPAVPVATPPAVGPPIIIPDQPSTTTDEPSSTTRSRTTTRTTTTTTDEN